MKMHRLAVMGFLLSSLLLATICYAMPLDTVAANDCVRLTELSKKPMAERSLGEDETRKYLDWVRGTILDRQLVGVLALTWATDTESLNVLKARAEEGKPELSAGAASCAVLVRMNRGKPDEIIILALESRLKTSRNCWEKMFVANRHAVDFPDSAFSPIFNAARAETDKTVQCDMLYYLSKLSKPDNAKDVLSWSSSLPYWSVSDALGVVMGSITPGRPKDGMRLATWDLNKEIIGKIDLNE